VKSSIILLIIGGALLVIGLAVSAISVVGVTTQVLEGGALIEPATIEPGLSYVAVMKDLPAGRQVVLTLDSEPADVMLTATLTESDGDALGVYNITRTPFTSTAMSREQGDHALEITNIGSEAVTVSGALLNSPVAGEGGGVSVEDDPGLQSLIAYGVGILVGIVLIISGIVILIIGAIKHFRSRKAPESVPSG
jgi:hypothetical protein